MRYLFILLAMVFMKISSMAQAGDTTDFEFDKGFTVDQEKVISDDLTNLKALQINSNDPWMQKIFGGGTGADVFKYLNERVNYFVPWTVDIGNRVWGGVYSPPPAEVKDSEGNIVAALGAYNIGTDLFFVNMRDYYDFVTYFMFHGTRRLDLTHMRIGLVEIGPRYFSRLNPNNKKERIPTSRIERMAFLIHEARHSDCTGGLNDADFDRVRARRPIENKLCGYEHVKCPPGHKYAGVVACEDLKWGSYAVEAMFLTAVVSGCQNCTTEEMTEAQQLLEDRKARVLNWDRLMTGELGAPDMGSGGPPWEHL